ncbi:MAG: cation:proton antiporter [Gammaproteobacteria bacterium]|nr:cation:proton antiporter [Gammaproteobacteria bacterium]
MSLILITVISICVSSGILLLLSREVFKMIMGLAVLGTAANLVVFTGGRPGSLVPAVIEQGSQTLMTNAASPLPQALVLTAIVIGFALLCFALILAAAVANQQDNSDVASYRENEPSGNAKAQSDKPSVMEIES